MTSSKAPPGAEKKRPGRPLDEYPECMRVADVIEYTGRARNLVYASLAVNGGPIPAVRLGAAIIVPREGLRAFLAGDATPAEGEPGETLGPVEDGA